MRKGKNEGLTPGDYIVAIIRDSDGKAEELGGYLFVAEAAGFYILVEHSKTYNGLQEALRWMIWMTRVYGYCTLRIFPAADCYTDKRDAEEALIKEHGTIDQQLTALFLEREAAESGLLEDG